MGIGRHGRASSLVVVALLAVGCTANEAREDAGDESHLTSSAEERRGYLANADIFVDGSDFKKKSALELKNGPEGEHAFPFNAEVTCDFVEPDKNEPLGGMTPKFACKLPNGDVIKVKYSREDNVNHEVYSEILASRIAWAIGLPADRLYPVHVTCNNCPEEPWAAHVQEYGSTFNKLRFRHAGPRATRRFAVAAIEGKFEAKKLNGPDGEAGWGWDELPGRPGDYWKMGKAERAAFDAQHPEQVRYDALRLYAAWIKHADNKADNQRMVCLKKDLDAAGKCARPLIMIHDFGVSFAGGTELGGLKYEKVAKASLNGWTNQAKSPTWKDFSKCEAGLRGSFWSGTLDNPRVSNAGRRLIAQRLATLDNEQLTAIFEAARIEDKGETWTDPRTGQERAVTVADWVHMFGWMRDIISKECPE